MPTYNFFDTKTGEEFEMFMSISSREEYLRDNPHILALVTAPAIISGSASSNKVPDGFKEVLSKISEKHPSSALANKHRKKSIKEAKTERIVKDFKKKISKL